MGFFAVAAVVCINLFLHAHRISTAAAQKAEAVRISQNCAESFLAADGDMAAFSDLLQRAFPEAAITVSESAPADPSGLILTAELLFPDDQFLTSLTTECEEEQDLRMYSLHICVSSGTGEEITRLDVCDLSREGGLS